MAMTARRLPTGEARPPSRALGTAARHLVGRPDAIGIRGIGSSRPGSAAGQDKEDEEDEAWSREVRASIKSRGARLSSPSAVPSLLATGASALSPSQERRRSFGEKKKTYQPEVLNLEEEARAAASVSPTAALAGGKGHEAPMSDSRMQAASWAAEEEEKAKRLERHAAARSSAYFEDLIAFLEMHSLPGAYALALSANGVEDLSQLLLLEPEELDRVITNCDLDAMDEILLKDALRQVCAR
eukprot:TRINITY_DN1794_c0_g1_i1.p1 TRINITY_DN1794_c0_g1~~TRINITY_DN1794_c0_g1_i1.p1  ORF type:complete len:242 (+),score=56.41 TRINITY_DN1794_c0_g1_i1:78-803(+)